MNKYYAVLGLSSTASKDEVRRAYRKLVLQWHPDKNPSPEAHAKFIAITEAYDILMGERAAPRTGTTYRRSTTAYAPPKPKIAAEIRREKRQNHDQMLREKFMRIREQHFRAPDFYKRKEAYYAKSTRYFILAGSVAALGILIPVLLGAFNLIWTAPVAFGLGLGWFFTGGRIKMRADMIYSGRVDYSAEDIREFFSTRTGFLSTSSSAFDGE